MTHLDSQAEIENHLAFPHRELARLVWGAARGHLRVHPSVLDVGTGTGEFAVCCSEGAPSELWLLDESPDLLEFATQRIGHETCEVTRVVARADRYEPPPRSFDLVASVALVEWLPELSTTLHAWSTALAPGGLLAIGTFGPRTLDEVHQAGHHEDASELCTTVHPYDEAELRRLVEDAGLVVVAAGSCLEPSSDLTAELVYVVGKKVTASGSGKPRAQGDDRAVPLPRSA